MRERPLTPRNPSPQRRVREWAPARPEKLERLTRLGLARAALLIACLAVFQARPVPAAPKALPGNGTGAPQPPVPAGSRRAFEGSFAEPRFHGRVREVRQLQVEVLEGRQGGSAQRYEGFRGVIRVINGSRITEYRVVNAYLTLSVSIYLARHGSSALTLMLTPSASMQGDTPTRGTLLYDDGSFARDVKGVWHARPRARQGPSPKGR